MRLQQALNQKSLAVPPHILDMEAQMKKEFAAEVRKSRSLASPAGKTGAADGRQTTGNKRKQPAHETPANSTSSKKTKITMKVGDVEVWIDHDLIEAVNKSKKIQASTSTPKKTQSPSKNNPTAKATPTSTKAPGAKGTPRQNAKIPPTVKAESNSSPSKAKPRKATPKIKSEVKSELDDEDTSPSTLYITGTYNITCPQIEAEYQLDPSDLRLNLCVDNHSGKVWGGFELGPQSGVLLIADGNDVSPDVSFNLGWRARKADTGRLTFGRGCFGEIVFFGERQVRATFFNMFPEPVDFEAWRKTGPLRNGRSAWQFQREWEGFVSNAYGR